jgi:hypothetical protein
MDPKHPLSARRLYALLGEKMHDLPPYFIERLEQRLEEYDATRDRSANVVQLHMVSDTTVDVPCASRNCPAGSACGASVAVPMRTLHGLAVLFDLLHAAHLSRLGATPEGGISEQHVGGLILTGQALLSATTQAQWSER